MKMGVSTRIFPARVKINASGSNGSNLNLSIQHVLLELLVALEDALDSYLFIRRLVQGGMAFTECAPVGRKKALQTSACGKSRRRGSRERIGANT
jgi:hypothetical protein